MSEFERWETRFSAIEYIFGEEPNAFLASKATLLPKGGRVLALADGEGRNGVWLAGQGLDVLSLEFSPAAQAKAKALAARCDVQLTFELADVHDWTFPDSAFDVVVDIFTQFSDPEQRLRKWSGVKKSLKPGGLLLMEGYAPKQLEFGTGGPKVLDHLYTRQLLEQEFSDFARIEIEESERMLSEGIAHAGMSALIDVVGWK